MSFWSTVTSPFRTRSYAAVSGGRRAMGRQTTPVSLSAMMAAREPLAARARYLAANNALAESGVQGWVSALVGSGVKPQSAHSDTSIRGALNLAFETWTDDADADGLTDFYGLQSLMVRRMVIDGESFALLVNGPNGLRIRLIDPQQIDSGMTREVADPGGRIVQGVEFNADGERVAYHVFPDRPGLPYGNLQMTARRIPADDVIHLFRPETPGQVRGVSWFAPVMLRIGDLDQWRDAQLARQKVAAMLAGFIRSADVPQQGDADGDVDFRGNLIGGMEPGSLKYLGPGEEISFSTPAAIGAEVMTFAKVTEREIAVGLGLPASILTGDLSDTNYSSIRAGLVEWRRRIEAMQHGVLAFQMLRPIWRRWAATEVLSGRVTTTVADAMPVKWIVPKQAWVDPSKDVEAELAAIAGGLMSRREAVTSRGVDIEALDAEIAADNARATDLGLTFSAPDAANQNQPPASAAA